MSSITPFHSIRSTREISYSFITHCTWFMKVQCFSHELDYFLFLSTSLTSGCLVSTSRGSLLPFTALLLITTSLFLTKQEQLNILQSYDSTGYIHIRTTLCLIRRKIILFLTFPLLGFKSSSVLGPSTPSTYTKRSCRFDFKNYTSPWAHTCFSMISFMSFPSAHFSFSLTAPINFPNGNV